MTGRAWLTGCVIAALAAIGLDATRRAASPGSVTAAEPQFEPVQPELFAASGGQPNCWADYVGDGDLDLFVGFRAADVSSWRSRARIGGIHLTSA